MFHGAFEFQSTIFEILFLFYSLRQSTKAINATVQKLFKKFGKGAKEQEAVVFEIICIHTPNKNEGNNLCFSKIF